MNFVKQRENSNRHGNMMLWRVVLYFGVKKRMENKTSKSKTKIYKIQIR